MAEKMCGMQNTVGGHKVNEMLGTATQAECNNSLKPNDAYIHRRLI